MLALGKHAKVSTVTFFLRPTVKGSKVNKGKITIYQKPI